MAAISAWGIDIGQAGLKAMKLRVSDDGQRVVAAAFDYVPHPKILSQPDAIPEELIREAMKTFLERNKIDGDLIAISVPGQSSLAKFIKLPPVEASKVAEIVRYEARQQIPFDLNDVIWDYQPIGGGVEESGFMLEAEVGLFAMKRELVYDALKPFVNSSKEVEIVQIAPLALYNYLSYDVLGFRKTAETPEPPAADDYHVILDMGADNTTLLVSNGRSIWIRNVPIGGNHFTRALTREMKLTFAKAEHLKCNATKAPDPKAVFQAMRPVFNDYVSEIQRSIGFFGSVNRAAKIRKIIGVGNGFRLAGLQKFLQQNLQYEVERLESLNGVTGDSVLTDPLFIDNMMTFAVPYGLALQAIGKTRIRTTLLPPEIAMDRKIRSKKPWAVAAAAGLLLAMGVGTMGSASVLNSYGVSKWEDEQKLVADVQSAISAQKTAYGAQEGTHAETLKKIDQLVAPLQKRSMWMELFKAINVCMPYDQGDDLDQADITLQKSLRIKSITAKKVEDASTWHKAFVDGKKEEEFSEIDKAAPASGIAYIITLKGHHYYNNKDKVEGVDKVDFSDKHSRFIEKTLIANLRKWTVSDGGLEVPVGKIGITHPILAWTDLIPEQYDPNRRVGSGMTGGGMPGGSYPGMTGGYPGMSGAESGMGEAYGGLAGGEGAGYAPPGMGSAGAGMGMGMGKGMGGSFPGGSGGVTGNPAIPGAGGPKFKEAAKKEVKILDRTDFVVQFVWTPTLEKDRKNLDPRATSAVSTEDVGSATTETSAATSTTPAAPAGAAD